MRPQSPGRCDKVAQCAQTKRTNPCKSFHTKNAKEKTSRFYSLMPGAGQYFPATFPMKILFPASFQLLFQA
jgi:hypothetical protein